MIDFKYHLVSLISVFMALAIGIVLGAGPLQNSIGETLSAQVQSLRTDKANLQRTVATQTDQLAAGNKYLEAVGTQQISRQLNGHHVVTVRFADAPGDVADVLTTTMTDANAVSSGTVTLSAEWTDPTKANDLDRAAQQVAKTLGQSVSGSSASYLQKLLTDTLVVDQIAQAGSTADRGPAVLAALSDEGLIKYQGNPAQRADAAVLVSGISAIPANQTDAAKAEQQARVTSSLAIVKAFRDASAATVLAAPRRNSEQTTLVASLRTDRTLAARVTGVDDADWTMGHLSCVFGLREELAGQVHQYGTSPDAQQVVPASLTPTPSASSS